MVDLPTVPDRLITSEAPTSAVTRGDIQSNANMLAGAVDKTADALMDVSVEAAKKQAGDDLLQQKVTRNADGSVALATPANSMIFGRAGETYNAAVKAGTIASNGNIMSQGLAELHAKYPTDHEAFRAASDAFIQTHAQAVGGPIGEAALREGQQLQTQHLNAIVNTSANLDVDNQKKSLLQQIADQKDTAIGLARLPGGTDSPEFNQAVTKMNLSYDALGTNPLFKMPLDQIEREKKNTAELMQGESLVAHIDATYTRKGKADAQKDLQQLLSNPDLREVDRTRLYTQGLSRLAYLTADGKEKIDAGRKDVTAMEGALANNTLKAEDPVVGMAIEAARGRGDPQSVSRLNAAVAVQQHFRAVKSLPDAVRSEVVGSSAQPDVARVQAAILGQESGNNSKIGNSIDGAMGPGQIMPATFAQYAKPGERIDNPDDNRAVNGRILADYAQRFGNDPARMAVAYFSGPGNVAPPGSPTPYKRDARDGNGKSTSGYVSDVLNRLGTAAPAANGGPGFTYADVQRNPFLTSAYVRTLAADEELRVTAAKQTATSVGKALDIGVAPAPESVAEVRQAAKLYPQKMGAVSDEMEGRLKGGLIAALPQQQRDSVIASYKAATDGQDQHHINIAAAALKQDQEARKNLAEHPYQEAANRGWIQQPAPPVDPSQPDSIGPALAQRAALSARIGSMNHMPAPPLLDKDEMPQLQAALQGPQGGAVLGGIAQQLDPDDMNRLLEQKGFSDVVVGMMSSKDPSLMSSAMGVVDKLWRDNAAKATSTLGDSAITKLQAWQGLKGSFSAPELAERLNASDDPSTAKARQDARDAAEKETKALAPADMAYKLGTSWGIPIVSRVANLVTGATPAVPFDSIKGGELVNDYRTTYAALRAYGVDADKASDLSMQRLGATWGVSQAAGNQVMKNPPERSYPAIGGSKDWIGDDLKAWVGKQAGAEFADTPRSLEAGIGTVGQDRNWSIEGMVSDGQTQAEIKAGRPPSYQVAIRRKDGTLDILPSRIAFDPSDHIAKYGVSLEQKQEAIDWQRNGQFGNAMPLP